MGLISISKWGPGGWNFLHAVSFTYPEVPSHTDKQEMLQFLFSFTNVIPCLRCRRDFKQMLNKYLNEGIHSEHLKSRDKLSRFVVQVHNKVNKKLFKKELSYEKVVQLYYGTNSNMLELFLSITIIFIISFFMIRHLKFDFRRI